MARAGNRLFDISKAIDDYISGFGYGIVRDLVGHGVGSQLHEDPQIPNFAQRRRGPKLRPGMTLAVEPMINMGSWDHQCLRFFAYLPDSMRSGRIGMVPFIDNPCVQTDNIPFLH